MQEFKDKMENFKYLRQQRAAHYQGIYIALLVSAIVLFIDLIAGTDILFKIILIIGLVIISEVVYRKNLIQAQKPIIVCENAIGTLEKYKIVKGEDGVDYAVCSVSDFIHKNDKEKR